MDKHRYRVIGPTVAGVTRGGEVVLDPLQVNIPALLIAGFIEPIAAPAVPIVKPVRGERT